MRQGQLGYPAALWAPGSVHKHWAVSKLHSRSMNMPVDAKCNMHSDVLENALLVDPTMCESYQYAYNIAVKWTA